ncbi:hypothetical protein AB0E01_22935 [Nocardia vinacea]|uniref:hypothetical protein n=1 Tax=Nocardia vinacea TaxID=96468 RepID=UPI0033CCAFF3
MERIDLQVGDRVLLEMPYSEAMMHMRLAGSKVEVEVLEHDAAQLLKDGGKYSFPVTWGEAGIRSGESGPYAYDGKLLGGPNCKRVFFAFTPEWASEDPVTAVFVDEVAVEPDYPEGVRLVAYAHVGQHVQASPQWTRDQLAATPEQYAPLLRELTDRGYRVVVVDSFEQEVESV